VFLWRISSHSTLEGRGGELGSARWHTALEGKRIVYLAEHPALALIESLVNIRALPDKTPDTYQLIKVEAAVGIVPEEVEVDALPTDWKSNMALTQQLGDTWLARGKSALLKVRSVPCPESWNYLLNPLHPDAQRVRIDWCRWIAYDNRLFGFREKQ
jgi:RES domain-containing protein